MLAHEDLDNLGIECFWVEHFRHNCLRRENPGHECSRREDVRNGSPRRKNRSHKSFGTEHIKLEKTITELNDYSFTLKKSAVRISALNAFGDTATRRRMALSSIWLRKKKGFSIRTCPYGAVDRKRLDRRWGDSKWSLSAIFAMARMSCSSIMSNSSRSKSSKVSSKLRIARTTVFPCLSLQCPSNDSVQHRGKCSQLLPSLHAVLPLRPLSSKVA